MNKEKLLEFYTSHRGEILGASIGLAIAILVLILGFFKTMFIVVCMVSGYYIGKRISGDRNYIRNLLDRILPPGTYR